VPFVARWPGCCTRGTLVVFLWHELCIRSQESQDLETKNGFFGFLFFGFSRLPTTLLFFF